MKRSVFAGGLAAALAASALLYYCAGQISIPAMAETDMTGMALSLSQTVDPLAVSLSHPDFFYTEDIEVSLTGAPGAQIYYTTDGTDPSPENGTLYTQPIPLRATGAMRATVLKVRAFRGEQSSQILTHTYFLGKKLEQRFNTLVFSVSTDPDHLYDYETGIFVPGKLRDDWQKEHPGEQPEPPDPANYNIRGMEGERPAYVEVFEPDGTRVLAQAVGIRTHGGWSRDANRKSFKLFARQSYETGKGKFRYRFFPSYTTDRAAHGPVMEYDKLLLRNGGNDRDFAGMREELSQRLAKQAGFLDYQEARPASVFMNGTYYGFAWLHNVYDEKYLADRYGGNPEDFVIMDITDPYYPNLSGEYDFQYFCNQVDLANYLQYYAFQIYIDNYDWPMGNKKYWRYTGENGAEIHPALDGKWRWMLFDAEYAWGLYGAGYQTRTLERLMTTNDETTRTFAALLKRPDVQEQFCNQMMDLMHSVFREENVEQVYQQIISEMDWEHSMALASGCLSGWVNEWSIADTRNQILDFAANRAEVVLEDMRSQFGVTDTYTVQLVGPEHARAYLNTLQSEPRRVTTSTYFVEHTVPVSIDVFPGYRLDHWEVNGQRYTEETLLLDASMAQDGTISIKAVIEKDDALQNLQINEVHLRGSDDWIELYNPNQESVSTYGYFLSDDLHNLRKMSIPTVEIEAGGFLLLAGKDTGDSRMLGQILMPFSIKDGETLYLSDINGNILTEIVLPQLNEGETMIRMEDGCYTFSNQPTPGKENKEAVFENS